MPFAFKLAHRLSRLRAPGLCFALAALGACETTRSVSVPVNPTIASVVVTPDSVTLTPNQTSQFYAYGRTDAGDSVPITVTWAATGGTITSSGLFTAGSGTGDYTVSAQAASHHGNGHVKVKAGSVASVTVTPSSDTGNVGDAAQFTATLQDSNGNLITGSSVTWTSTNTAVVTVSATGYTTAVGPGAASIVATSQGKSGRAQITVNGSSGPGPVASVTVSPASTSILVGATQAFSAVLKDANGTVVTGPVTWSSSAPTIAGISLSGVVTGLLAGTSTITATSGGVSGTASVTVNVLPPPPSWPNEPSGLAVLSDQPWNTLGSWVLNDNTAGHTSLVTLGGLPFSPSGALQDLSPIGMTGGGDAIGPGRADFYIPAAQQPTEIYVGMWVKLSNPYQPHSSGVQKILYLHDNNGVNFSALWLEIYGTGSPFRASLVNQFYGCPSIRLDPNVTQTPIGPGEWHRYEMYVKMASTGSSSDGVVKVWVDGVLNVNRTDLCTQGSNTYKMESVRLSGMWGGIGDAKTEVDYLWYDHTYVSGR
ncbi:MAG TPA: Ig-like domain-containing protein [Gemmatimonadales bacterium]|nr:Ig-like domain-containing protein [Gemmatimonadales bacterium]